MLCPIRRMSEDELVFKFNKTVGLLLSMAVVLALLGTGGVYLYPRLALPVVNGRLAVPGLNAPVEVIRDRWGVPHIYANNEDDLFFAQGYVQAQDRLWQMDLCRRAAQGTLAEVLGEDALPSDRLARTLGFARGALAEWAMLEPDVKQALEAYARGVNAYLSAPGRRLPVEFQSLGYTPAPWQPLDSLAYARLAAWGQSPEWREELLRARLVRAVGPERAAQLELAGGEALAVPGELADLEAVGKPLPLEDAGQVWPWFARTTGGNCWAVDGSRSVSGHPLLAADLHLPVQMPSPVYEMHLVGGRYDAGGATLPGIPGVVIGRNRSIAWGSTTGALDTVDLYVERVRPGSPLQVEYQGQWEDVQVVAEQIGVRGHSEPVQLPVYVTRHGPLITEPVSGQPAEALALCWAGKQQATAFTRALLALNRATNWEEFRLALRDWTVPAQTLIYADTAGNIGYVLAGSAPVRIRGDGSFPVPGWVSDYEWYGLAPTETLPWELNPPSHSILAAGGLATGASYPGQPQGPAAPYQAEQLSALLAARDKLTAEDMRAIQNDLRGPEQPLLNRLLALPPEGWLQERTTPYLRDWDLRYDSESAGAGIFEAFYWRLAHNTWDDELGAELVDNYLDLCPNSRAFLEELGQFDSPWFDDQRTPGREGRDEIIARSYAEGIDRLGRRFGDLPYEWNWGRVHNITFRHALGQRWPLTILLNRGAMRASGSPLCLSMTGPTYEQRMTVETAPLYRLIADLGSGTGTVAMNTPGQSGNPFSPHYTDMIEPWRKGDYHPLLHGGQEAVLAVKEGVLVLAPAE